MSIYLSDYSITNSSALFRGLWNKIGFSGNTIDAGGIRLGTAASFHSALPQAFLFLQILCQPLPVENSELANHLVPVAVPLCPLLRHILARQIEHLFQ